MKNITHLPTKATEKSDGGFTMIPNEMVRLLASTHSSERELRIIWFLIGELQGWQMKERIIKTSQFIKGTKIPNRHLIPVLKVLLEKGIIERESTGKKGCYIYRFNEAFFGKTHATKIVRLDKRILEMKKKDIPESGTSKNTGCTQVGYNDIPESGISAPRRMATMAAHHFPKDLKETYKSLKEEKNIRVFHSLRAGNGDRKGEWASPEVIQKCMLAFRRMPK